MSKELLEALAEPFGPESIKQRQGGGGKMLSYISTDAVIRRLNKVAIGWDFKITSTEWKDDLFMVFGELTIPGLGTRAGIGVQKVSERGGEDLVKGGSSDSLKKAATLFGVALHLYGPDTEAEAEAGLLSEARKRFRLRGIELEYKYADRLAVTDHIRELVPGHGEPTLSEVEAAIVRINILHKTAKVKESYPEDNLPELNGTPTDDPSIPDCKDRALFEVPAATTPVIGNYATDEFRGNDAEPQGRKGARSTSK